MTTWILVNRGVLVVGDDGPRTYFPSATLDDATIEYAQVVAAGGEVWPSSDAIVSAAAARVAGARLLRGISDVAAESMMRSAVARSTESQASAALASIIFRQGAATLGNVCGTWADLILAVSRAPAGPKCVGVDGSANGGHCDVPAGDWRGIAASGEIAWWAGGARYTTLNCAAGARLPMPSAINGIDVTHQGAPAVPLFEEATPNAFTQVTLRDCGLRTAGTAPMFRVAGAGARLHFTLSGIGYNIGVALVDTLAGTGGYGVVVEDFGYLAPSACRDTGGTGAALVSFFSMSGGSSLSQGAGVVLLLLCLQPGGDAAPSADGLSTVVQGLRGRALDPAAPTNGQVYAFDSASGTFKPTAPGLGGIRRISAGGATLANTDTSVFLRLGGTGGFSLTMPTNPADGQRHTLVDVDRAWLTNPLTLNANAVQKIRDPVTYVDSGVAGAILLGPGQAVPGAAVTWEWGQTEATWFAVA